MEATRVEVAWGKGVAERVMEGAATGQEVVATAEEGVMEAGSRVWR